MDENQSLFELEVDTITGEELVDTARWQRMFGIVMLVIVGLVLLVLLVAWNMISGLIEEMLAGNEGTGAAKAMVGAVAVLTAGVVGSMAWFIIRGAGRIRTAIRRKDQLLFNNGLSDLKIFFMIYGIISILSVLFNLVALF